MTENPTGSGRRSGPGAAPYQYLVLRCVPRADRQEFVNVGVVLYCQRLEFLACASEVDPDRLGALDPELDVIGVREALARVGAVCSGHPSAGPAGVGSLGVRFGHLAAPRSTVVQPGPVHGGVLSGEPPDPGALLEHLLSTLVAARPSGRRSEDVGE